MAKNKKNTKKRINLVSKIIFVLYALISIFLLGLVLSLKVLPSKYLLILIPIYLLFTVGSGFIVFKDKFKSWLKIVMDVIYVILIGIMSFGLYYLNTTLNFMDKIKSKDYQIEEYYVIVLKDSKYETIKDLNNDLLAIYEDVNENYVKALNELDKKIDFKEKEYDTYIKASKALLDEQVDALFLSASYKSIVDDELENFESNVKILDKIELKVENKVETVEADVKNESFNIYISGIDIYGDISLVSRSDVNMIATVNPKTHTVLLTSIPRDYYVQLHGTKGYKDKLTHAGIYGINMSVNTIEDLLDIDINYYVRVNFTTLINIVDAIGGIDIYSDTAFTAWTNNKCVYKVGNMHLNGACALAFARERHAYQEGDRHRVQNQQDVLKAILNKALSSKTLITKYSSILESLGYSFQTSMPSDKIYELVNMQLDSMPSWEIKNYSVNGSDSRNYTYSYSAEKLYVMEPDMKTVEEAKALIKEVAEAK